MIPVRVVRWNLQALDLQTEDVAEVAGIALEDRTEVTYEEAMRFWNAAEVVMDDAIIGHRAGASIRPHELGVVGSLFAHAEDLRSALDGLARVLPVVVPGHVRFAVAQGRGELTYRRPPSRVRSRHGVESLFANVMALARHCTRRSFAAASVELANPRPPDPAPYAAFYGVAVTWDASEDRLGLAEDALALPMTGSDPALRSLLLPSAEGLVHSPSESSPLERRVAQGLLSALHAGAPPTLEGTARSLGVSSRTLQRQLEAAGITFRSLRARTLRRRAEELLADPRLSIEEIGAMIGYDSRSAFDRAFRAWTGQTPARFRAVLE